ncbi:hypothetical protein KXQ82_18935 [Mucilaginibacter sp. HMF5004]|uniref:hypothetical protein n=1 Tax=Mucilaginibacter rivuli TaxID=2857527 RepID=UPI001C5DCBB8|nr:hypothetical protein [Mucilaginibacter rivuli]MBW4891809.1 hypothetical protein [Mucilaginibacter rivuli]
MKKISILIIAFCISLSAAKAQLQVPAYYGDSYSIGADVSNVMGEATVKYKVGVGVALKREFHMTTQFNLTASVGVQAFIPNSTYAYYLKYNGMPNNPYVVLPLKVGGRYYIADTWYAEAAGGAVVYTSDYRDPAITVGGGTGFSIPTENNRAFDIGVRFENWYRKDIPGQFNIGQTLTVRLAYKFGL